MSMPSFPEHGLDLTCEQAINMLLGSIAMEELALSHIMNAEGEKLQYILGTLNGSPPSCASTQDLLDANNSITKLLNTVMQNQLVLKGKLEQVLEARGKLCPPHPPHPPHRPPCPPTCCDMISLYVDDYCWDHRTTLPWQCAKLCGNNICWSDQEPDCVILKPQHVYLIDFYFRCHDNGPLCISIQMGQKHASDCPVRYYQGSNGILSGSLLCPVTQDCQLPISILLTNPMKCKLACACMTIVPIQ